MRSNGSFYDDLNNNYLRVDSEPSTLRDTVVNAAAQDEEERSKLPVEVIYSTIVKPRRKKKRPPISAMLQLAASMQVTAAPEQAVDAPAAVDAVVAPDAAGVATEVPPTAAEKVAQADINENFIVVDGTEAVAKDVIVLTVLPGGDATPEPQPGEI